MSTVFTKIIDGELPGNFAWADDVCVVFASINPITDGHMLVVSRKEVAKFTDLDDATLAHLMCVAAAVGRAQEKAFDAPRATMMIAGFDVPHVHLHVLPAWGEGELSMANATESADSKDLARATERIRMALVEQGHGDKVPAKLGSPSGE